MNKTYDLNVLETYLPVRGLTVPLTIVQVTDLHFIYTDESDGEEVNALRERYAQWFSNGPNVADEILRFLESEPPDAVVFTGDIVGYPTQANIRALEAFLTKCPPYLFVYGNHERIFTAEDLTRERMRRFDPLYAFALKADPELQVFELPGVRLIGIDDSDNQITPSQLEKMQVLFEDGKPCLLFLHVPICLPNLIEPISSAWGAPLLLGAPKDIVVGGDEMLIPTATTEAFVCMLKTEEVPVEAIFAGHVHFFDRDDEFASGKKQFITPMANMPDRGTVRRIHLVPAE